MMGRDCVMWCLLILAAQPPAAGARHHVSMHVTITFVNYIVHELVQLCSGRMYKSTEFPSPH